MADEDVDRGNFPDVVAALGDKMVAQSFPTEGRNMSESFGLDSAADAAMTLASVTTRVVTRGVNTVSCRIETLIVTSSGALI